MLYKTIFRQKMILRNQVRGNFYLYWFWIKVIKQGKASKNIEFPSINTDLFFTGFPRCGNTFAKNLLHEVFPEKRITTHIHNVASVKRAISCSVPIGITIRCPLNSIASLALMQKGRSISDTHLNKLLSDYIVYHKFLLNVSNKLNIFMFNDLVSSTRDFIIALNMKLFWAPLGDELDTLIANGVEVSKDRELRKDPLHSSLPNSMRNDRKRILYRKLCRLKEFETCDHIYRLLKERAINCKAVADKTMKS